MVETLIKHAVSMKYRYARGGSQDTLLEIRGWDYGILFLSRDEGRGCDTRFKMNARVMITCPIDSYHELT